MKKQIIRLITVLMMNLLLGGAIAYSEVSMEAFIGYDGVTLDGRWFPIEIRLRSTEAFEGRITVACMQTESEYDQFVYPVSVPRNEEISVRFPISTLIPQHTFEVELLNDRESVAHVTVHATRAVDHGSILAGVLGASPQLIESFCVESENDARGRGETMEAITLDMAFGQLSKKELDAFQMIVVDPNALSKLSEEQEAMLEAWVFEGGILISEAELSWKWVENALPVNAGERVASSSAWSALRSYAVLPHEPEVAVETTPLDVEEYALVRDDEGQCFMAGRAYGNGYVLLTGFSLVDQSILSAAQNEALWQRLLLAIDKERYNSLFNTDHRRNYTYGGGLNERQLIDAGKSILPVIVLLGAYVCLCCFGWFIALKRRGRTGMMWLLLPVTACVCLGMVYVMSSAMDMHEPTAASFRVTRFDVDGYVSTEERALVASADKAPITITSEPGAGIERAEYGYFYSSAQQKKKTELRDMINLGQTPGITLNGIAPWKARSLVIDSPVKPEGRIQGKAWMEEDGLHALIVNDTDITLEEVYFFTSLGYKHIGELKSGQSQDVFISRTEHPVKKKDGEQSILDGILLEYPVSLYTTVNASVFVQEETDPNFDQSELPWEQRQALNTEAARRSFASSGMNAELIPCVLYAECPEMPCVQLFMNGKPITRNVQESLLYAEIPFETVSDSGYAYYPKDTFAAHVASLVDGAPVMEYIPEKRWYSDISRDLVFGFDLSEIENTDMTRLCIVSDAYVEDNVQLYVEVYDNDLKGFVRMPEPGNCVLSGDVLSRAVNEHGQVFIRYAAQEQARNASVYLPGVIVEGSVRP